MLIKYHGEHKYNAIFGGILIFLFFIFIGFPHFGYIFNKTIIPLRLVGFEMIIANSYPTYVLELCLT